MSERKTMHGWFSKQSASEGHGTTIWRRKDGTEIEVTCVDSDPDGSFYRWPDKVYLGEVVSFVRIGQQSIWGRW